MHKRILLVFMLDLFTHLTGAAQNPQLHIQKDNEAIRIEGSESWLSFFEGDQGKAFMQNYQGDLYIGTLTTNLTGKIRFYNNNQTRMIIDPAGNVGINDLDPIYKLSVSSTGSAIRGVSNDATGLSGYSGTGVAIDAYSDLDIAVSGNGGTYDFFARGPGIHYGMASSCRWKNNVKNIDSPLEKIGALRGVYFDWDDAHGGRHDVGFIAEEIGEVMPEIVHYEENGIDANGMDYSKITPLLVEAINAMRKEYQAEIDLLKKTNGEQILLLNQQIASLRQIILEELQQTNP